VNHEIGNKPKKHVIPIHLLIETFHVLYIVLCIHFFFLEHFSAYSSSLEIYPCIFFDERDGFCQKNPSIRNRSGPLLFRPVKDSHTLIPGKILMGLTPYPLITPFVSIFAFTCSCVGTVFVIWQLTDIVFKVSLKRRLSAKAGWASGASRRLGFGSKARGFACRQSSPVSARALGDGGSPWRGGRDSPCCCGNGGLGA
jgi:hypothetical protein